MNCKKCAKPLSKGNKSGICRDCSFGNKKAKEAVNKSVVFGNILKPHFEAIQILERNRK